MLAVGVFALAAMAAAGQLFLEYRANAGNTASAPMPTTPDMQKNSQTTLSGSNDKAQVKKNANEDQPANLVATTPAESGSSGQVNDPMQVASVQGASIRASGRPDRSNEALGCLIEPSVVVDINSAVPGLLDSIKVERGDQVQKGQVVASLDSRVERAAMNLAQARMRNEAEMKSAESGAEFAQRKFERNSQLHRDGIVSLQVREQAEAESQLANQRLNQTREQRSLAMQEFEVAKTQLALRSITSPVSGVVIDRFLSGGERVDDKPILKIAQIHPLRVEAILPSTLYGKIKTGSVLSIVPELPGAKARSAPVTIVDRVIDPASNSFRVRMELDNSDQSLPSGVRCKVNINLTSNVTPS